MNTPGPGWPSADRRSGADRRTGFERRSNWREATEPLGGRAWRDRYDALRASLKDLIRRMDDDATRETDDLEYAAAASTEAWIVELSRVLDQHR